MDESGNVVRNITFQVDHGYSQQERVDYKEIFEPLARLESIPIVLSYGLYKYFKLFEIELKNAFQNGFIDEKVFVKNC